MRPLFMLGLVCVRGTGRALTKQRVPLWRSDDNLQRRTVGRDRQPAQGRDDRVSALECLGPERTHDPDRTHASRARRVDTRRCILHHQTTLWPHSQLLGSGQVALGVRLAALDLIVRGIRSGLPATEAMNMIGEEIAEELGAEFRQICDQLKIGVNLDEALWTCAKRLRIPEFNFLVISMAIQQETGGNLAEILEKLGEMVRRREQMRLKIKAMSSEARASAMIIGSLPFIMGTIISIVNPTYLQPLFSDPRGLTMIAVGVCSLLVGLGVMAKMVRFDI
jgi:hypothetical protein